MGWVIEELKKCSILPDDVYVDSRLFAMRSADHVSLSIKASILLLVDLRDFFSDLASVERKKSSENDQSTGRFQSCFF